MKSTLGSVLFSGNLVVPRWNDFWWRYLILFFLGIAVTCFTLLPSFYCLWLHWDQAAGTVTSFGITLHPKSAADDFRQAVNDVYHGTVGVLYCIYILTVIVVYGLQRFWRDATRSSLKQVAIYVMGISVIYILGGYMFEWFGFYSGDPPNLHRKSIPVIVFAGIIAPIEEELFYRLTLYQMMRTRFGLLIAAILSSVIFGLLHFGYPEPIKMLMAGLAGLALFWSYEKTGSIFAPIGIHMINNLWMHIV